MGYYCIIVIKEFVNILIGTVFEPGNSNMKK